MYTEGYGVNRDQSRTRAERREWPEGIVLEERRGGRFRFRVYLTPAMERSPLEAMELSVRAYNSLMRAGYSTVGQLSEAMAAGDDLHRIRGCGKNTVREIGEKLFLYQYNSLPAHRRQSYLQEVADLNRPAVGT